MTSRIVNMYALTPVWVEHVAEACAACDGHGEVRWVGESNSEEIGPCDVCDGTGKAPRKARKGRNDARGPNGEAPDTGKWGLIWPSQAGALAGTIYDGPTVSPSSCETYTECGHKWALPRLDDLEKPPNRSADLGTSRHAELERWLKEAKQPTGEGMSAVLKHFPSPGTCETEVMFGFCVEVVTETAPDGSAPREGQTVRGEIQRIVFSGWVDARTSSLGFERKGGLTARKEDGRTVLVQTGSVFVEGPMNSVVYDLKTTKDLKWKKTAAQLRANIQAAIYTLAELLRVDEALIEEHESHRTVYEPNDEDFVVLKWVYAKLKEINGSDEVMGEGRILSVHTSSERTPGMSEKDFDETDPTKAQGVTMTRAQAVAVIEQYIPAAQQILGFISAKAKAKDVPKNFDSCAGYGGCGWKIRGGERGPKGQRPSPSVQPGQVACEVGFGSGFMAQHKQERARLGLDTADGVASGGVASGGLVQIGSGSTKGSLGSRFSVNKKTTQKAEGTKMGLGARFGNKIAGNTAAGAAAGAATTAAVEKPAEKVVTAVAAAKPSRFAKVAPAAETPVETPAQTPKLEQKATADGIAAKAATGTTAAAAPKGGTLMSRIKAGAKGGQAAAIDAAAAGAQTHAVSESVANGNEGALAVGINPPDAAKEWTTEQLEAEAAKLVSGKTAKLTAAASASNGTDGTAAEAKKRVGRPAGSTKAKAANEAMASITEGSGDAVAALEALAQSWLEAGNRRGAMLLLQACDTVSTSMGGMSASSNGVASAA